MSLWDVGVAGSCGEQYAEEPPDGALIKLCAHDEADDCSEMMESLRASLEAEIGVRNPEREKQVLSVLWSTSV